jgi:hypothetical protein
MTAPCRIYDLPLSQGQIHIHGSADGTILYGGRLYPYDRKDRKVYIPLDAYEVAMADYYAQQLGLKLIEPKRSIKPEK